MSSEQIVKHQSALPLQKELDLSATKFITMSRQECQIKQHPTWEEAIAFAQETNAPSNAVYVFELQAAFSKPWSLIYKKV